MLDLEKLMECVTEFNEISKAAEEEKQKVKEASIKLTFKAGDTINEN